MSRYEQALIPGLRLLVRDAEWIVRQVDAASDGGQCLTCDGVDELTRGTSAQFLTKLENTFDPIQILKPEDTTLVQDMSPGFRSGLLYAETCLRRCAPNDGKIHVAHKAAMDLLDYQLDPALRALAQPRQRILIADAVGLGKTLEAGILVSELLHRAKGKRILVVSLKSMLTQFQKEFWSRFSIPLTRLDSMGLSRVRAQIPTNHNPFYYYDKSIISIDTLKNNLEYRNFISDARWDIVIIDEAHNVAQRASRSQRSQLAQLLATRSDTLIMLSATPHDGSATSFASLINMLDPTAISDPQNYRAEDFAHKDLVVRRFQKDVKDEVKGAFKERKVIVLNHQASGLEEEAYRRLLDVPFVSGRGKRDPLVRLTFQKALFSSPRAAWQSCQERLRKIVNRLEKDPHTDPAWREEQAALEDFQAVLEGIGPENFSRYQALLRHLCDKKQYGWNPRDTKDRLVIFTERVQTLNFLKEQLMRDLKLKEKQVMTMNGAQTSDLEQQAIVEAFGRDKEAVRLLICTDVASEGINLHYLCHRLIHFDLPWSLISFQQRNGRIDRYGQTQTPHITYLCTRSENTTIAGDQRILEVLIEKDQKAYEDIGDPRVFLNQYSIEDEVEVVRDAMAAHMDPDTFDSRYDATSPEDSGQDLMDMFFANLEKGASGGDGGKEEKVSPIAEVEHIFRDDAAYAREALFQLRDQHPEMKVMWENDGQTLVLENLPQDLHHRFRRFPKEIAPQHNQLTFTTSREVINREIARCRQDENAWPKVHYLWSQHPFLNWLQDRMATNVGRHQAPLMVLNEGLRTGETIFVINAIVPNHKGHPLVQENYSIVFLGDEYQETQSFEETIQRLGLRERMLSNSGEKVKTKKLQDLLREAIIYARGDIRRKLIHKLEENQSRRDTLLRELDGMHKHHLARYESKLAAMDASQEARQSKLQQKQAGLERVFEEGRQWIHEAYGTDEQPFFSVVCVFS